MTSLESLLEPAQAGEAWALRGLYEQLAPAVLGYLRTRGAGEPEDLTSEVFLAVLPKLPTVTGGVSGLRTFVFSVAHARLVDDLRRRSRRAPAVAYEPSEDPRTSPSSEDEAAERMGAERVQALLEQLLPAQRDVLALRVLADLSIDETAQALGRTPGAVKQLQRRGLLALRAALEPAPAVAS